MKHSSPKKSFSSFGKGSGRRDTDGSARKVSDRPFKKGSSSSRPYEPNTHYGAASKSSSYRGKDFRGELEKKGESKPMFAKQYTPRTFSSTPSSSPKSVYVKTSAKVESEKRERVYKPSRTSHTPSKHTSPVEQKSQAVPDTSWGGVADWYNKHLEKTDDSYHVKVVFPNLLRMLHDVTGKRVLDMACGQGIFADKLRDAGAYVTGVDLGKELIKIAETRNESVKKKGTHKITYHVTSADDLYMLKDKSFDVVVCILAIQNIENLQKTLDEASRVLADKGTMFLVLNHPSFRNPKQTFWGYNEADDVQYRRVDEYMSESRVKIDMTPGSEKDKKFTVSFHRPLQVYVKALAKSGFAITRLEEWVSHKESEKGPKQRAENKARKEIPMFMCVEVMKM